MKIETTTKKFREGVKLSGPKGDEVKWESTGHLSALLLDASGSEPVVGRAVSVEVPGEGKVELESDSDGKVFYPDVPFADYELDLGDHVTVHAPAVANRADVQVRHVPKITHGFLRVLVRDADGFARGNAHLTFEGPDGVAHEVNTDDHGLAEQEGALRSGTYKITSEYGTAEVDLADHASGLVMVTLEVES